MKDEDFPCRKGLKSKQEMQQIVARTAEPRVTQEAKVEYSKYLTVTVRKPIWKK